MRDFSFLSSKGSKKVKSIKTADGFTKTFTETLLCNVTVVLNIAAFLTSSNLVHRSWGRFWI